MLYRQINNSFLQAFTLVKNNLILLIPFFMFLLVAGFILMPGSSPIYFLLTMPALLAVFLSGWLNMFKNCIKIPLRNRQEEDKQAEYSLGAFKEFFPGVGKYFLKIGTGILFYILLFNIFMLVLEVLMMGFLGPFESFTQDNLSEVMKNRELAQQFWEGISQADKTRLFQIAVFETIFSSIFVYFTMFWPQIIVLEEVHPIQAFLRGFNIIKNDLTLTFILFIAGLTSVILAIFINLLFSVNPLLQLISMILFVFVIVYFIMLSFVYLDRYIKKC